VNRQLLILFGLALAIMGVTAGLLTQVRSHQRLAPPGVRTHPVQGSIRLEAELPDHVLDFDSTNLDVEDIVLITLPKDTSFGQRRYRAADGFMLDFRVVLMGRDRTSLHKPQFCLPGGGWHINDSASQETTIKIDRPFSYKLPVVELVTSKTLTMDQQTRPIRGIYVYWYVADDAVSAGAAGFQRMWWMASKLLRTGVLQRWAYVSCFAPCLPGQEAATFERMKSFISAAVPQFQLYPRSQSDTITASR
jgi:hypothetical protein